MPEKEICMSENRKPTYLDKVAEDWVAKLEELSPETSTYIGNTKYDNKLSDYSPEGNSAYREALIDVKQKLIQAPVNDEVDLVTQLDLMSDIQSSIVSIDAGDWKDDLNVIASPAQSIREIFDLMPTETEKDWSNINGRLSGVREAIEGYKASLREGIRSGSTPALRQVEAVISQTRNNSLRDGFFTEFVSTSGDNISEALKTELLSNANAAAEAYGSLTTFLTEELAPNARMTDGIGREAYERASESFVGMKLDLDETYEWGLEELARMVAEQEACAQEVLSGATVEEAIAYLDTNPAMKLNSVEELQEWMQTVSDKAVRELASSQFDIPVELQRLECMIAPSNSGGIYYTGPSDDFTRAGRMWWSVPEGVTEFNTWRELTTVYHEGVPGHHLQIGTAVANSGILNLWRRQLAGTSGHAEGWALYAEKLMQELGYLDDPAYRLGMLDGQRMRAARVVLDIGVHLGKTNPFAKNEIWSADNALEFFRSHVHMNDEFIKFEVNRYLGWAGQAPSYKVGQRVWENLRLSEETRLGSDFDLKKFHSKALGIGGVRLDTLEKFFQV